MPQPGIADAVMPVGHRFFLRESLPSDVEIANSLEEDDWLGRIYRKYARETDHGSRTIDLCEPFDTVDLWIDPDPNAQLILIWLLEYFRPHEAVVSKLNLVQEKRNKRRVFGYWEVGSSAGWFGALSGAGCVGPG
jgi:hypothetical protein